MRLTLSNNEFELDRVLCPPREGEIWGSEPPFCCDAACRQIALAFVIITTAKVR